MPATIAMIAITIVSSTRLKARDARARREDGRHFSAILRGRPKSGGVLITAVHHALGVGLGGRAVRGVRLHRAVGGVVQPTDRRTRGGGYAVLALLRAQRQRGNRPQVRTVDVVRRLGGAGGALVVGVKRQRVG